MIGAWHAGRSIYLGKKECNDYSIGIELEGSDDLPFDEVQYVVLAQVTAALQAAYPKILQHLAGHSDIAPGRKPIRAHFLTGSNSELYCSSIKSINNKWAL